MPSPIDPPLASTSTDHHPPPTTHHPPPTTPYRIALTDPHPHPHPHPNHISYPRCGRHLASQRRQRSIASRAPAVASGQAVCPPSEPADWRPFRDEAAAVSAWAPAAEAAREAGARGAAGESRRFLRAVSRILHGRCTGTITISSSTSTGTAPATISSSSSSSSSFSVALAAVGVGVVAP